MAAIPKSIFLSRRNFSHGPEIVTGHFDDDDWIGTNKSIEFVTKKGFNKTIKLFYQSIKS